MPGVPTAAIWTLLVLANGFSVWGALRLKARSDPQRDGPGVTALAAGMALELAAIALLFLRYTRRL